MSLPPNTCPFPTIYTRAPFDKIESCAEKLACLLIETPEFQNFTRLERELNQDPKAGELNEKIYALQMAYLSSMDEEGNTIDSLNAQLEKLPVMLEFRRAERAVRDLFTEVDQIISQSAGMDFSANARLVFT